MIEDNNAVLLAEYRLLNACYSNPDFLYENGVTEDIFQHSQSKTIFNSIKSLYESKVPLTRESLWQDASNHDLGINNSIIDQVIDFTSHSRCKNSNWINTYRWTWSRGQTRSWQRVRC